MRPTSDVQKFQAFLKTRMPGPHAYVILLGLTRFDFPGVIERIEKGLPYSALERFQRNTGFTTEQMIELLQVPKRTLARRKAAGRLSAEDSDRLVRLARVYAKALHLFNGDTESATDWLARAQRAFNGTRPIEMIRTDVGAQEVETLSFQLEHGIFP